MVKFDHLRARQTPHDAHQRDGFVIDIFFELF
jgi:hypothetical protein